MDYFIVSISALFISGLTFFSGFGLGTLLMPVFALFFPLDIAIASTAVVHLCNNLFKFFLIKKQVRWDIVWRFGIPAVLSSLLGAWLLIHLSHMPEITSYVFSGKTYHIEWIKVIIGLLIMIFAALDIFPKMLPSHFGKKTLTLGGLLSGFFGGLSGHQGAFRSVILLKLHLPKEIFIATGITLAFFIDAGRLSIYGPNYIPLITHGHHLHLIGTGIAAAMAGSILGNQVLKKITMTFIQALVAVLLLMISLLLILGVI